nr:hypothetical protein [Tanacetum cinerariifolium]
MPSKRTNRNFSGSGGRGDGNDANDRENPCFLLLSCKSAITSTTEETKMLEEVVTTIIGAVLMKEMSATTLEMIMPPKRTNRNFSGSGGRGDGNDANNRENPCFLLLSCKSAITSTTEETKMLEEVERLVPVLPKVERTSGLARSEDQTIDLRLQRKNMSIRARDAGFGRGKQANEGVAAPICLPLSPILKGREKIIFNANEGATPLTVSPIFVINDYDVIDDFEGLEDLEELLMNDDINRDLGNFLQNNDLLPNFDTPEVISLSPSRSSSINRDPFRVLRLR